MTLTVAAETGRGVDRIVVTSDRDDDPDLGAERQVTCAGQTVSTETWTADPNRLGVYEVTARVVDASGQTDDARVSLNVVGRWQRLAARVADLRPTAAEPLPSGECPAGFPIKGVRSDTGERRYHLADDANYASIVPERCFSTEDAAQAAGFAR